MKKAKIGELRNGLSRYLAHVRAGGTVIVYERDTPIAEITPARRKKRRPGKIEGRLQRLIRRGVLKPPEEGTFADWLKHHEPVEIPGVEPLSAAIIEERRSGR
ncbi:MAG: type II toxin-antitoxin system Phd/YefM family antitoxin [Candidatus Binataceae bacterium]